jgi:CheY-like chemotaxis protein
LAREDHFVADDDPAKRQLIVDLLGALGFHVMAAEDGEACLRSVKTQCPDLLILDFAMRRMNGWDVARTVRGGINERLPIIMISADAGDERMLPEYRALHNGYLIKPFNLDDLVEQIGTALELQWIEDDEPTRSLNSKELVAE